MSDILHALDEVFLSESIHPTAQFSITCNGGFMVIVRIGHPDLRMRYDRELGKFVEFDINALERGQIVSTINALRAAGAKTKDISKIVGLSVSAIRSFLVP